MRTYLRVLTVISNKRLNRAEINPFRVLWIKPNLVATEGKVKIRKSRRFISNVLDGNWDLSKKQIEDKSIIVLFKEHFQLGVLWHDTSYYKEYIQNKMTERDFDAKYAKYDDLFWTIKKSGYKIPPGIRYGETGISKEFIPTQVAVKIGREGNFLFWDGIHRLAIAKILDLPLIPVRVVVRHKLWQELRDEIKLSSRRNKLPDHLQSYTTHPDISYLLG